MISSIDVAAGATVVMISGIPAYIMQDTARASPDHAAIAGQGSPWLAALNRSQHHGPGRVNSTAAAMRGLCGLWQSRRPRRLYAGPPRRASRWGCGPRQVGARSPGASVCCDGFAGGIGIALPAAVSVTVPVSLGPTCSLRNSYSILAPACARCPSAAATCDPTAQASDCRPQNCFMSETAALAAKIASPGLMLIFDVDCDPPLGRHTRITVSQNPIRRRNRMSLPRFPAALFAALGRNVAARLETAVRPDRWFLPSFEAN